MIKQPVIKWVGGKLWCCDTLAKYFPVDINNIYDPFVGGGGMIPAYVNALINGNIYVSDLMQPLVNLWHIIQTNPDDLYTGYKYRWNRQKQEGQSVYYEYRDLFNQLQNPIDFFFLIRLSVNGMVRFNSKGEFNASFHITRDGIEPERLNAILSKWHNLIKDISFRHHDYREILPMVQAGDFVFLDPPYATSGSMYTNDRFDPDELWQTLDNLNSKGVNWMLTYDGESGIKMSGVTVPKDVYVYSFSLGEGKSGYVSLNTKTGKKYNAERLSTNTVYLNYIPQITGRQLSLI